MPELFAYLSKLRNRKRVAVEATSNQYRIHAREQHSMAGVAANNPTRPRRPQAIFTDDLVAVERNGARAEKVLSPRKAPGADARK